MKLNRQIYWGLVILTWIVLWVWDIATEEKKKAQVPGKGIARARDAATKARCLFD